MERCAAAAEDSTLLPLADELLDEKDQRRVLVGFRETEAQLLPRPVAHFVALVDRAEARLCAAAR